jgi:hypothetical protein
MHPTAILRYLFAAAALATAFACEEAFIPPVVSGTDQLVVEGYIEAGDVPTPPYVLVTRSFPFFNELSQDQLSNAFVHDATVTVSDGTLTVVLTEICLDDIPPAVRDQLGAFIGVSPDSIGFNICVYLDTSFSMLGEAGKTYTLTVATGSETVTATTTIPDPVPLDTLYFTAPPGQINDTLAQLLVRLNDPPGVHNYYRYFTRTNDGFFDRPFTSVTDDRLFDGQQFLFPLTKAEPANADFDFNTFGLYRVGDETTIKWMNIDKAQFDFWNSLEFSRSNQGPFSSYTRVSHTVSGGLGVWAGISARYYTLRVQY